MKMYGRFFEEQRRCQTCLSVLQSDFTTGLVLEGKVLEGVGGNITILTRLCEHARQEAFEIMCRHADEMGANAVIGVRYDATEVAQGVTEVLCYGTAVRVEPLETHR